MSIQALCDRKLAAKQEVANQKQIIAQAKDAELAAHRESQFSDTDKVFLVGELDKLLTLGNTPFITFREHDAHGDELKLLRLFDISDKIRYLGCGGNEALAQAKAEYQNSVTAYTQALKQLMLAKAKLLKYLVIGDRYQYINVSLTKLKKAMATHKKAEQRRANTY